MDNKLTHFGKVVKYQSRSKIANCSTVDFLYWL